ncbi:MAG: AMP-binding protein, partial [Janthinobacterium lividum]
MDGSVTDMSLIISGLLEHGAENFGDTEVVTREVDGSIQRYGYADANVRAKRLASTLARRGVGAASRVATLAWNTRRHFEMFYAAPGIGALLHTVNPRLSAEHLVYIINDARDEYLFVDPQTITMAEQIAAQLWSVHTYVFMGEKNEMPTTTLPNLLNYEALVAEGDAAFEWPDLDERTPAVVCYTSGTTGQPKGVVYTHRSIVLQSFMGNMFNLPGTTNGERQVLLALAPMFHATAWNFPFIGPLIGAKIVFPGRNMEPEKIYELLEQEQVTRAGGVPSIWVILTDWMEANGKQFSSLKHAIGAGSTVSQSVIQSLLDKGLEVYQTWGMTEIPHASSGLLKPGHDQLSSAEQLRYRSKSGRAIYGMRLKLVDDAGKTLPRDGVTAGHLRVKGLWAAASYLNKPEVQALDEQGWMITGDIATIDQHGYM